MKKKNLKSVAEYAQSVGYKSVQAVFNRAYRGRIKFAKTDPQYLIDIVKYPPIKPKRGRIPYKSKN